MELKHNFPGPDPELESALANALKRYNCGDTWNRRRGAIEQFMAMIDYLRFRRIASLELLRPAHEMVTNLGDLEFGKQHSTLRADRHRKGGRPPITTPAEMLREGAAVAVSILMDGGMQERVARKLGSIGLKVSPVTVGNWRSQVMAHLPDGVGFPGKRD